MPSCDPGAQDCPDGEKCTAYVTEPGACCVDANKCVPIVGDRQFGQPCIRTEENDDCARGLFCMGRTSGDTGQGICFDFCSIGDPDACQENGGECTAFNGGTLPLCESSCNPLLQDCESPFSCYAASGEFLCAPPGGAFEGEPCETIQHCQPGLVCASGTNLSNCNAASCCTSICDLAEGTTDNPLCTAPTEQCVPWYQPGMAPQGQEDVGTCGL